MQLDSNETLILVVIGALLLVGFVWWASFSSSQPIGADRLPTFELKK